MFKYVSTRTSQLLGSLTVETVDAEGASSSVITLGPGSGVSGDIDLGRTTPEESLALRFTLHRSADDATLGGEMNSWQVKALPAIHRSRDLMIPVFLFERMADAKGSKAPAIDPEMILDRLETMEDAAEVVSFSTFGQTQRVERVTIQKIEFTKIGPPLPFEGEGGIAYLTLRTVQ